MHITTLSALAEPSRLRIVELLGQGPRSVNEIAELLSIRQPQASKHLQRLTKAGLVRAQPKARQRVYTLRPEPLTELDTWIASLQQAWESRLAHLDNHIKNMEEKDD